MAAALLESLVYSKQGQQISLLVEGTFIQGELTTFEAFIAAVEPNFEVETGAVATMQRSQVVYLRNAVVDGRLIGWTVVSKASINAFGIATE